MATAEALSAATLEQVATEIVPVVLADEAWMREARPDTFRNFGTEGLAVASLQRLMRANTIHGYVLRDDDQKAMGLATRIASLCIYDPSDEHGKRRLEADQIDYWTRADVSGRTHVAVTKALLAETQTPDALAILSRKEQVRALGIPLMMRAVGDPQRIRVPFARRDYGLCHVVTPLQVYRYRNLA